MVSQYVDHFPCLPVPKSDGKAWGRMQAYYLFSPSLVLNREKNRKEVIVIKESDSFTGFFS